LKVRRSGFLARTLAAGGAAAFGPPFVASAQSLPVLRIGTSPNDGATVILYAAHADSFRKAGIDAQLTFPATGTAVVTGVLAGALDIGQASLVSLMNAHLRGVPLTLIAPGAVYDARKPFADLVGAVDAPFKGGKDLNGKTIGTPALGDFNALVTSMWVDRNGGDSKTLKFVEIPNSAQIAAIVEHRIDGAVVQQPDLADGLETKRIKVIGHAYSAIADSFMISGWLASAEWAAKHPDLLRAFVRVMADATVYTNAHHAETAQLVADATKIPVDVVRRMGRVDSAVTLDPAQIQPLIDASAKYKLISSAFPAKELIFDAAASR
jgi:NitT/TauT family transport system substrate-binding protein